MRNSVKKGNTMRRYNFNIIKWCIIPLYLVLLFLITCEGNSNLETHSLSEVSFSITKNPLFISYDSISVDYTSEQFKIDINTPGLLDQHYWFGHGWAEPTAEADFQLMDGSPIATDDVKLKDDWSYSDNWSFNSPLASDWQSTNWQFIIPKSVVETVENSTEQRSFKAEIRLIGQDEHGSYLGYTKSLLIAFNF